MKAILSDLIKLFIGFQAMKSRVKKSLNAFIILCLNYQINGMKNKQFPGHNKLNMNMIEMVTVWRQEKKITSKYHTLCGVFEKYTNKFQIDIKQVLISSNKIKSTLHQNTFIFLFIIVPQRLIQCFDSDTLYQMHPRAKLSLHAIVRRRLW